MPGRIEPGGARDEEASHLPPAISDRIAQRRTDRAAGNLEVSAGVNQHARDVGVVAARRPAQRRLAAILVSAASVQVRAGFDEHACDARPVREVAGPVRHDVQWRASLRDAAEPRRGQARVVGLRTLQSATSPPRIAAIVSMNSLSVVISHPGAGSSLANRKLRVATRRIAAGHPAHAAAHAHPQAGATNLHVPEPTTDRRARAVAPSAMVTSNLPPGGAAVSTAVSRSCTLG